MEKEKIENKWHSPYTLGFLTNSIYIIMRFTQKYLRFSYVHVHAHVYVSTPQKEC